ncbi:MAG: SDR family oxidoreductase [Sedimentisphaerales bacterium]|nr:SDR family oxidoreductase [Sedimentisphaerales bacterium]
MGDRKATALVTGASSGIGAELARVHAARGGDLVILARRAERLEALKAELESAYRASVYVLVEDLADPEAPQRIYDEIKSRSIQIDYLMNNAGFGFRGAFHEQDWERNQAMIQVNITALAALTRLFAPEMVARRDGRILNVASMAGFLPGPLQSVYYASKAFVVSFTEALANELAGTGVTITALCPGPVETEFVERAGLENVHGFAKGVSAREVAECGYDAMLKGRTLIVPGLLNAMLIQLLRFAPRKIAARISRRMMDERYADGR